jgi:hypothetical protein
MRIQIRDYENFHTVAIILRKIRVMKLSILSVSGCVARIGNMIEEFLLYTWAINLQLECFSVLCANGYLHFTK